MIRVLEGQDFATPQDFVEALNKARLANRKQWIFYIGQVAGHEVQIKTFDIGDLQILRVDGRDFRNKEYGMNVGQWKAEIVERIELACR